MVPNSVASEYQNARNMSERQNNRSLPFSVIKTQIKLPFYFLIISVEIGFISCFTEEIETHNVMKKLRGIAVKAL